jgi:carboxypeptidase D
LLNLLWEHMESVFDDTDLFNAVYIRMCGVQISGALIAPCCSSPMLSKLLLSLFTVSALCVAPAVNAHKMTKNQIRAKQAEAAKRWQSQGAVKRASSGVQNLTFSNPKASRKYVLPRRDTLIINCSGTIRVVEFWVDGSAIPEVDFDIGPSWSGLLPISNKTGETRKVNNIPDMR